MNTVNIRNEQTFIMNSIWCTESYITMQISRPEAQRHFISTPTGMLSHTQEHMRAHAKARLHTQTGTHARKLQALLHPHRIHAPIHACISTHNIVEMKKTERKNNTMHGKKIKSK